MTRLLLPSQSFVILFLISTSNPAQHNTASSAQRSSAQTSFPLNILAFFELVNHRRQDARCVQEEILAKNKKEESADVTSRTGEQKDLEKHLLDCSKTLRDKNQFQFLNDAFLCNKKQHTNMHRQMAHCGDDDVDGKKRNELKKGEEREGERTAKEWKIKLRVASDAIQFLAAF